MIDDFFLYMIDDFFLYIQHAYNAKPTDNKNSLPDPRGDSGVEGDGVLESVVFG